MDPVLYGPGEGEHHDAGPAQIFIKATGEHTAVRSSSPKARSHPGSPVPRRSFHVLRELGPDALEPARPAD